MKWFVMLIDDQEFKSDSAILSGKLYPIEDERVTDENGAPGIVYPLYPYVIVVDEAFFR